MIKRVNRGELPDIEAATLIFKKKRFQDEEYTSTMEAFVFAKKNFKKHLRAIKKLAK